jgi:hypothetical protein
VVDELFALQTKRLGLHTERAPAPPTTFERPTSQLKLW